MANLGKPNIRQNDKDKLTENDTDKLPVQPQNDNVILVEHTDAEEAEIPVAKADDVVYYEFTNETDEDSHPADDGEKKAKKKSSVFSEAFDSFETFCYALVLMMVLFIFVFRFVIVNGHSMLNTLQDEDKLIISDVMYTPHTGDIVVLEAKDTKISEPYIIKRIIATGGQKVEIDFDNWAVSVDGILLNESYVNKHNIHMESSSWINEDTSVVREMDGNHVCKASFTVPEGKVFVMGDNRNASTDGRYLGCLEEERIVGRVLIRIAPAKSFGRVQ